MRTSAALNCHAASASESSDPRWCASIAPRMVGETRLARIAANMLLFQFKLLMPAAAPGRLPSAAETAVGCPIRGLVNA
jgi:hypothetical protein